MGRPVGPRTRRHAAVLVGTGTYTLLMFSWFSLPAYLGTLIAEIGLSGAAAGLLAGAVPLVYVPMGIVSGLVVDRVGAVRSLAVGVAIVGLAQLWRSIATGFPELLAGTLLLGVGGTAITFGLPKLVGVLFPAAETGVPTSTYLVGAAAGSAGAFAVGRPALGPSLGGWRPLFFWTGLVALGYAAVVLLAFRALAVDHHDETGSSRFEPAEIRRDLTALLGHRDMRLLVAVATMYLLLVHGLQGWLPTILEARGIAPGPAGQSTSLFVVASTAAVVIVPPVADRHDARRTAVIGAGLVGLAGLGAIGAGGATGLTLAGIAVAGFGAGSLSPLVRSIPPDLENVGARRTGTAMGLAFAVGEIGGFSGPFAVGALFDATGSYLAGLGLLAAGAVVVVGSGLALSDV